MEQFVIQTLQSLAGQFPWLILIFNGVLAAYPLFKFVTKLTKTNKDDVIAEKLEKIITITSQEKK